MQQQQQQSQRLQAVPAQGDGQAPMRRGQRQAAFRSHTERSIAELSGDDALSAIMQAYTADMAAHEAHIEGLNRETTQSLAQCRMYWDMLQQVQTAASHGLHERATLSAELSTYRGLVELVRQHIERADGVPIMPETLAAALSAEPITPPVRQPVTTAFVASERFRGGQFVSQPVPDVTFVFTFIGWALVDHGPGAHGSLEPMFLVNDRAMPRSAIEGERHVRLECYLTNSHGPVAA